MAFLLLGKNLSTTQLFSIRSAGPIGRVVGILLNPNNLKIEAFYCRSAASRNIQLLLTQDVRQVTLKGLIIDDHEHLSDPEELPRLSKVIDIDYQLIGKGVRSGRRKVGQVTNYIVDQETFFITKLYVQPGLFKRFDTTQLVIARQQIIEVNDNEIVIKDTKSSSKDTVLQRIANAQPSLSNSASAATTEE